jgi:hypothetical protein
MSIFGNHSYSPEMKQKLHIQRFKLEQLQFKIGERVQENMAQAKVCLERGDEEGYRIASQACILAKSTGSSINDLIEMSIEMLEFMENEEILHDVILAGKNLAKIQCKLGIDSSGLESSLSKIRVSMSHMEGIANALTTTIEASITNPKQLSADQEALKKELLAEVQTQKTQIRALKDTTSTELQPA